MDPATDPSISQILSFWFDRSPWHWFRPPPGFDADCTSRFSSLVSQARAHELDGWAATPSGALALIVLLDQLPRNLFRGSAATYSSDGHALDVAVRAIARGFDKAAEGGEDTPGRRPMLFSMPLMHAENLVAQVACVALLEDLHRRCVEAGGEDAEFLNMSVKAARGHRDVIEKFGRFPSRNALLRRENTPEEEEFLREFPDGFRRLTE